MYDASSASGARTDPGAKEERQKRKGAWISHTSPRTRGTRYANVYKATGAFCSPLFLRLFRSFPLPLFSSRPPVSRGLSLTNTHVPRSPEEDTVATSQPYRPSFFPRSPTTSDDRSVVRSVPRYYFARGAGRRGKSRLRRMNKILFSSRAAKCAPPTPPPRFFAKRFSRRWTSTLRKHLKNMESKDGNPTKYRIDEEEYSVFGKFSMF